MKHLACILLCLLVCLSFVGCAPGGYLNSTDGDITVSLPEISDPALPEFTEEQKLILGEWKLVSITENDSVQTFDDSHYTFAETGKLTAIIEGTKDSGSFVFKEDVLYLWGNPVVYRIENDTLTISTLDNKVHLLTKVVEQPEE